jgi:hypothetical protein
VALEKRTMRANRAEFQDERPNQQVAGAVASTNSYAIATAGELFPDGSMIELIAGGPDRIPQLMLWDGKTETVADRLEYRGQVYAPARLDSTVLQELNLPTRCHPHGSTSELLAEIRQLIAKFVALDEKSASLVGRIVLCSALVDVVSVAPVLVITGPDIVRGNRLMELLHSLCRHSVSLTSVTPAGFRSLAGSARFTFLISQTTVSEQLQKLLEDASSRDRKIPHRGRLLDLFGIQVIQSDSAAGGDFWPGRSVQISMVPTAHESPVFDLKAQHRLTIEFQQKLLSFRRANLGAARDLKFNASKVSFELRDLARSLAAATPDDPELQAEVFDLLRVEDTEIRSARWIDPSVIAAEAIWVACQESPGGFAYVAALADDAQGLLMGRGEETVIDPGVFGKQLKQLGFVTEPRDAKGRKLRLTEQVRNRAQQLMRDFGGPDHLDDRQSIENQRAKGV